MGKFPTGCPEDTHYCPLTTCQSKLSRKPSPLRSSMNSKSIDSCPFLQKQTIICLISWCRSFPLRALFHLFSCHLTMERQEMEERSEEVEEVGGVWQVSIGLTSSFFPFPSLPPLFLGLSLFILHFFPFLSLSSFCCSYSCKTTLACIADSRDSGT